MITLPFDGGFSKGDLSEWGGSPQCNLGSFQVVSSYGKIAAPGGNSGGYMGLASVGVGGGGSTRAEVAANYLYADFDRQTRYFTCAYAFDSGSDWAHLPGYGIALTQILARNLQSASVHLVIRGPGWNGQTRPCVVLENLAGLTVPQVSQEQDLYLDETAGNGWNVLAPPGQFRSAQRWPVVLGDHVFGLGGSGSLPLDLDVWHQFIVAIHADTDTADGWITVYYRRQGASAWTTVLDTSGGPGRKTVQWNDSGWGQPAHPPPEGVNNVMRFGAYCAQGFGSVYRVGVANYSIQTDLAAAKAVFAAGRPSDVQLAAAAWAELAKTTDAYPTWVRKGSPAASHWAKAKQLLDQIGI